MQHDPFILLWSEKLTGLEPERISAARDELASWDFPRLSAELLSDTVDDYVATTLLVEGVRKLEEAGVPRVRLLKKLRLDNEVWSTWSEFRTADILLRWMGEAELRLEEGKSRGAHADFRFVLPEDQPAQSVEVKAVGLSDEEVDFCARMAPSLDRMLPREGLGHLHAPINGAPPKIPRELRRELSREARRRTGGFPGWQPGLRGITIVAHGSEASYGRRVGGRVAQAARQLPVDDAGWVAIPWSNGAPYEVVAANIPWTEIPSHVEGVFLVGCGVAFPHPQIHCFATPIPRGTPAIVELELRSLEPGQDELAAIVLERFERSSGVRPTLLQIGSRTILRRDGSRRVLPFNLLMDDDDESADRSSHNPMLYGPSS